MPNWMLKSLDEMITQWGVARTCIDAWMDEYDRLVNPEMTIDQFLWEKVDFYILCEIEHGEA
ncbi:MAG TPA: hypothetical protein VH593_06135 [Ktedonobacteraceae bacterium]